MGEQALLNDRQRLGVAWTVAGLILLRATVTLWSGWWWLLTMPATVYCLAEGVFYFRAAWLGQSKTFR